MEKLFITEENLKALAGKSSHNGYKVVGLNKQNRFTQIADGEEFVIGSSTPPSNISMKEYFFPKTETIFFYQQKQQDVEIIDPESLTGKTLVLGVKPCDAAALPILSKVFNWDYKDDFFNDRVNNSIVIGTACQYKDEYCFCESVGLDQNNTKGSDLFLVPLQNGGYRIDVVTEKGKKFAEEIKELLNGKEDKPLPPKENTSSHSFKYTDVKEWLDKNFEHPYWNEAGEMCLGCAQCAFACPTCHCFDIVDEQNGSCAGRRAKNWDACQFSLFTKHASGHNPRDNQEGRYRQRVNHKFKYYMDKFDEILCTGCGRCSRGCPVSTDILQILQDINTLKNSN